MGRYPEAYVGVPDDCPLTMRQLRIVRLAARGHTYGQIAAHMKIHRTTVRSHIYDATRRCDLKPSSAARVHWLVMLATRRGWLEHDDDAAGYTGGSYSPMVQSRPSQWQPSPAQRLYLDAFDRLLTERDDEAVDRVDFMFGVMCRERGIADSRPSGERRLRENAALPGGRSRSGAKDVDEMLLRMAVALRRPVA